MIHRAARIHFVLLALLFFGCADLALRSAPPKTAQPSTSPLAAIATAKFWEHFTGDRYEKIPEIRFLLTAAYLQNPNDPKLALLLAHTHLWQVAERGRLKQVGPEITDHLILAERYFEEAQQLAPGDDRIPGWLGAMKMALGKLHRDERVMREGYLMARAGARAYPHFNGFSLSYSLIRQPAGSALFQEAVEAIWSNAEICAGRRFDRARPVFRLKDIAPGRRWTGQARVCGNSEFVPHNVEGFFLHLGDLLLKAGEREAALEAYEAIKNLPSFASWRYRAALEDRLAHADEWSRRLRDDNPRNDPPYLASSNIACVACHAR